MNMKSLIYVLVLYLFFGCKSETTTSKATANTPVTIKAVANTSATSKATTNTPTANTPATSKEAANTPTANTLAISNVSIEFRNHWKKMCNVIYEVKDCVENDASKELLQCKNIGHFEIMKLGLDARRKLTSLVIHEEIDLKENLLSQNLSELSDAGEYDKIYQDSGC